MMFMMLMLMPAGNPQIPLRNHRHIPIMSNIHTPPPPLGPNEGQDDHIHIHAGHEDANHLPIVVALDLGAFGDLGRELEPLAGGGFDGGGGRADEIAELVSGSHDEGSKGPGGEFHEVDWNHAPCALDAELLEEGGGGDVVVSDKGVWVEEETANDGHGDDAEPSAEDLGAVTNHRAAGHGAEVSDDLSDGDGVGAEVELVGQHGGVEVLGAVGHEVESRHEEDEVDEQDPVAAERDFAFLDEGAGDAALGFAGGDAFAEGDGLGQEEAEDYDEDWGAGSEPEEGAPAVLGGVD